MRRRRYAKPQNRPRQRTRRRLQRRDEGRESNRFAIALNHENPECEVVISECERYAVVDKIAGWGLRIARETDPRSSSLWQPRTPA